MIPISALETLLKSVRFQKISWLLKRLEGFQSLVYQDIGGYHTVGYGHQVMGSVAEDPGLKSLNITFQHVEEGLSEEFAHQLLAYDLTYRANIQSCFNKDLEDPVWVALTSFCFNVGLGYFQQSIAFKSFHVNPLHQTGDSLSSWRECESMFSEGIAKRRLCEVMILLQKPLIANSPLLPSKQFEALAPMTYTDENWTRLSLPLKEEAIEIYHDYQENFK